MKKAYLSVGAVVATALLSGIILWRILMGGSDLGSSGLAGIFLTSMLSHLTVVARDMFVPLFISLTSVYNPLLLGFFAGTGGAVGEVTTYFLGWGVAESIQEGVGLEDRIASWINRYGLWAVLLVALTPLPDTPIVLLAGSRRLPFKKLFMVEVIGKTVLYSVGAVVGGYVFLGLEDTMGSFYASILVVVGSIIFTFAVTWKPTRDWFFGLLERLIP
jgi:membrane protein YqaA with SNARE-associated domain